MAKNPENYNPLYEEQHDEELRLYGKDKKTRNYIPVEHLASEAKEILEQVQDQDLEQDEDETDWLNEAIDDEIRNDESEKRIKELKKQIFEYHESNGAASIHTVSPEEKRISFEELQKPKKTEDEFAEIEKEILPRISRKKTGHPVSSMSSQKVEPIYHEERKYERSTGEEHDNLKTFKKAMGKDGRPKMERSFRQKIKDFFTKQMYGETPLQKFEESFDEHPVEENISDSRI